MHILYTGVTYRDGVIGQHAIISLNITFDKLMTCIAEKITLQNRHNEPLNGHNSD